MTQSKLSLTLLGSPQLELEGTPITGFRSTKSQALLYYLAATQRAHTRFALAGLFWGEYSDSQSRTNLSKCLSDLRRLLDDHVIITRQTVAFDVMSQYSLDLDEIRNLSEEPATSQEVESWIRAAERYRGDFLEGFYVRDAPEFEEWMLLERSHYRRKVLRAWEVVANWEVRQGDLTAAIAHYQRALALEPTNEVYHRQVMRLLAQSGQRTTALTQFEKCRQVLEHELGVEPSSETLEVLEQIRTDKIQQPGEIDETLVMRSIPLDSVLQVAQTISHEAVHNLPQLPTPFIGRTREVEELSDLLRSSECKLLTLIGPGGIGKTRLAVRVAHVMLPQKSNGRTKNPSGPEHPRTEADPLPPEKSVFTHGVAYVPLETVSNRSGLVAAIAQAVGFQFYQEVPLEEQLFHFLKKKQMLLLLDNFEQLSDEAAFLSELLQFAPGLKILTTSREALNLHEAWSHRVDGLVYPRPRETEADSDVVDYDAVQFFCHCAQRMGVRLGIDADHNGERQKSLRHIVRICQLVNGVPLGIELATTWLRVMSLDVIVAEIEQGLDILTSRNRNMPKRHRSMRTVLEQSWTLLTPEEQMAAQRLSFYRDSFDRSAAEQVAGIKIFMLAALEEKSFLYVATVGRYRIHELLRQFLSEKLSILPDESRSLARRHSHHYLKFLATHAERLVGAEQRDALEKINQESGNITAGWQWAVDEGDLAIIQTAMNSLYRFNRIRSRYQEGQEQFSAVTTRLADRSHLAETPVRDTLLCQAAIYEGAFLFFLGRYEQASARLDHGLRMARAAQREPEIAAALNALGQIAGWRGEKRQAQELLQASLAIYRRIGDENGLTSVLHKLAQLCGSYGEYSSQKELAEECFQISRRLGRPDRTADALDVLGWATLCLGEYRASEAHYRDALTLFNEIGDRLGIALALGGIGSVAWAISRKRLPEARAYFLRSLSICQEIGHRHHLSSRYWYLGQVANDMGHYDAAQEWAERGLTVAREIGSQIFVAYNLCCLGEAACATGAFARARHYLLQVMEIASDADHLPPLAMALIHYANLCAQEVNQAKSDGAEQLYTMDTILDWLNLITKHPGCWHVFRERARVLAEELAAGSTGLPNSDAGQTTSKSLEEAVTKILAEAP